MIKQRLFSAGIYRVIEARDRGVKNLPRRVVLEATYYRVYFEDRGTRWVQVPMPAGTVWLRLHKVRKQDVCNCSLFTYPHRRVRACKEH